MIIHDKQFYCIPQINSYTAEEIKRTCNELYDTDKCDSSFLPPEEKGLCSVIRFATENQPNSEAKGA